MHHDPTAQSPFALHATEAEASAEPSLAASAGDALAESLAMASPGPSTAPSCQTKGPSMDASDTGEASTWASAGNAASSPGPPSSVEPSAPSRTHVAAPPASKHTWLAGQPLTEQSAGAAASSPVPVRHWPV